MSCQVLKSILKSILYMYHHSYNQDMCFHAARSNLHTHLSQNRNTFHECSLCRRILHLALHSHLVYSQLHKLQQGRDIAYHQEMETSMDQTHLRNHLGDFCCHIRSKDKSSRYRFRYRMCSRDLCQCKVCIHHRLEFASSNNLLNIQDIQSRCQVAKYHRSKSSTL